MSFENRRRPGHSSAREQRGINAVARRIRERDAFPMRKFADARLPKRRAIHAGNVDGVSRSLRIELHQLRSGQRSRKRAVSRMIPSSRANAGRVAKSALHFVSDRRGGDRFLTARADTFGNRKNRREIIARMRRLFGKVGVVVIEIANATAVRECSPIRRRFVVRPDDCRSILRRKIRRDFARDRARLFVPGADRAAERIDHAPFHFVNDVLGKIFEIE